MHLVFDMQVPRPDGYLQFSQMSTTILISPLNRTTATWYFDYAPDGSYFTMRTRAAGENTLVNFIYLLRFCYRSTQHITDLQYASPCLCHFSIRYDRLGGCAAPRNFAAHVQRLDTQPTSVASWHPQLPARAFCNHGQSDEHSVNGVNRVPK